jgi:hypothetical protein
VLKAAQSLGGGQKAPALQLLAKHDVQPGSGAAAPVPAAPASPGKRDAAAACCVLAAAVSWVVAETSMLLYRQGYAEMRFPAFVLAGQVKSAAAVPDSPQDHPRRPATAFPNAPVR